jgi:hypothetical protein
LAAGSIGSRQHWQQAALAAGSIGSNQHWQQAALAAGSIGSRQHWQQAALAAGSFGSRQQAALAPFTFTFLKHAVQSQSKRYFKFTQFNEN